MQSMVFCSGRNTEIDGGCTEKSRYDILLYYKIEINFYIYGHVYLVYYVENVIPVHCTLISVIVNL